MWVALLFGKIFVLLIIGNQTLDPFVCFHFGAFLGYLCCFTRPSDPDINPYLAPLRIAIPRDHEIYQLAGALKLDPGIRYILVVVVC